MELQRRLLLAHCGAHLLSVLGGLLVVVPMALTGSSFKGRCALFSSGYWARAGPTLSADPAGGEGQLVVQQWGPPAACQFVTFVGIFTVLYGAAQGWRGLFYLHGRHDDTLFSSFLTVLLSMIMLFLSGAAAAILSLGLDSWCDTVTDNNNRFQSCADAQFVTLHLDVDTSSFYLDFNIAQLSLWCVTLLWLVQSVLSFLRLYHSHSQSISRPCLREKQLLLRHSPSGGSSGGSSSSSFPPSTPTLLV